MSAISLNELHAHHAVRLEHRVVRRRPRRPARPSGPRPAAAPRSSRPTLRATTGMSASDGRRQSGAERQRVAHGLDEQCDDPRARLLDRIGDVVRDRCGELLAGRNRQVETAARGRCAGTP